MNTLDRTLVIMAIVLFFILGIRLIHTMENIQKEIITVAVEQKNRNRVIEKQKNIKIKINLYLESAPGTSIFLERRTFDFKSGLSKLKIKKGE